MTTLLARWLRRSALTVPLALATVAAATVAPSPPGDYPQARDALYGYGSQALRVRGEDAACRAVPLLSLAQAFEYRMPSSSGLQFGSIAALPDVAEPLAAAGLQVGRHTGDVWAAVSVVTLLLLMQQRAALSRMRRRHSRTLEAQRLQLEAEVSRCTRDLSELARHLHTVREDESRRLARDLHDELGSLLTVAKLNTARLKRTMGPAGSDVRQRLEHLETILNQGMALKQRIIENLMPSSLTHLGLAAAIEIQAREFSQRTDLPVETELTPVKLEANEQITIYRLVQECLTNIARHAGASHVRIVLAAGTDQRACIRVCDDGRGFDLQKARCSGHGLLGMRYRVEAMAGSWQIRSAPGQGTQVEASLPMLASPIPT